MKKTTCKITALFSLVTLFVMTLGTSPVQADDKKDPTGTWTWTIPGQNGRPDRTSTLKLKKEGEKLTGKISTTGRQGQANEIEITDAKVKGEEVSFTVTREFNGNKIVSKYEGKMDGDKIKGKIETDRNGQTRTTDWEAKKETEKK